MTNLSRFTSGKQTSGSGSKNYFYVRYPNPRSGLKNSAASSSDSYEAGLDAIRSKYWGLAIERRKRRRARINSIKTQIYCNIAQFSEKHLGSMPKLWANILVFSQNLVWGGKMNSFEKNKEKEEAVWKSIEGKYPAKVIKDTRLYMDILDYYWYKAACVPTLDEAKDVLKLLLDKEFKFNLERVMDAHGYVVREFGPEIDRRVVRLSLRSGHSGPPAPNKEPELSLALYKKAFYVRVPFADLEEPIQKGKEPKYSVPEDCKMYNDNAIKRRKEGYEYMKKYVLKTYGGEP